MGATKRIRGEGAWWMCEVVELEIGIESERRCCFVGGVSLFQTYGKGKVIPAVLGKATLFF